jgi:hypothetical protein
VGSPGAGGSPHGAQPPAWLPQAASAPLEASWGDSSPGGTPGSSTDHQQHNALQNNVIHLKQSLWESENKRQAAEARDCLPLPEESLTVLAASPLATRELLGGVAHGASGAGAREGRLHPSWSELAQQQRSGLTSRHLPLTSLSPPSHAGRDLTSLFTGLAGPPMARPHPCPGLLKPHGTSIRVQARRSGGAGTSSGGGA